MILSDVLLGWGGGGWGRSYYFRPHLGVGYSVVRQMEGVGHVFSNHRIFKCCVLSFTAVLLRKLPYLKSQRMANAPI